VPLKLLANFSTDFKAHIDDGVDDYSFIRGIRNYSGGELFLLDIADMCLHVIDLRNGWYYLPGEVRMFIW